MGVQRRRGGMGDHVYRQRKWVRVRPFSSTAEQFARACAILLGCTLPLVASIRPVLIDKVDTRASSANITQHESVFTSLKGEVATRYFSNEELASFMFGIASKCSHMMSVFSIGKSTLGTDILAFDLSSSAGERDDKPYFHYLANMHGDEPSGRQLSLAFALRLCEEPHNPDVARLLTTLHIIVVPCLNPDGFARKARSNWAGVDLNRDYPDRLQLNSSHLPPSGKEQPETLAVMRLATAFPFSAGANFHEGALVANYPWDADPSGSGSYAASTDDATYVRLAKTYAVLHTRMSTQGQSPYQPVLKQEFFKDGITNGNQWYRVYGSMQDWIYIMGHCLELTLELWEYKYPEGHNLTAVLNENKEAVLKFPVIAITGGVRGTVTSATPGPDGQLVPLTGQLAIKGIDVPVSVTHGAFARPLAPGTYTILASSTGFQPQAMVVQVPEDGSGVQIHFKLHKTDNLPVSAAPPTIFPYAILAGRGAALNSGVLSARSPPSVVTKLRFGAASTTKGIGRPVQDTGSSAHTPFWHMARFFLLVAGPLYVLADMMRSRSLRGFARFSAKRAVSSKRGPSGDIGTGTELAFQHSSDGAARRFATEA